MKTNWNDLKIKDLITIKEIEGLQLATEAEKNLKVAAIIAEKPYEQLLEMPFNEVSSYISAADFLFTPPKARKVKRTYVINGRKYKLLKNEMELLTSQYIDFQAIQADGFDKRPGELMAVMMVPEGHNYNDGYDNEQVIADMYDMPVEEALGIVNFFTTRFVRSIAWTGMYYKWIMWWKRILAPRKEKEMWKAMGLQVSLVMDELNSMFGSIV